MPSAKKHWPELVLVLHAQAGTCFEKSGDVDKKSSVGLSFQNSKNAVFSFPACEIYGSMTGKY